MPVAVARVGDRRLGGGGVGLSGLDPEVGLVSVDGEGVVVRLERVDWPAVSS